MERPEPMLLLGLFRRNRFSYARAAVIGDVKVSFIDSSVADDLRCYEEIDLPEGLEVEVPGVGRYLLFSVCVIDRAVFNGYEIPFPTVVHVARVLSGERLFEACIGRDLIDYWQLRVDPLEGVVRSRVARRVRPE